MPFPVCCLALLIFVTDRHARRSVFCFGPSVLPRCSAQSFLAYESETSWKNKFQPRRRLKTTAPACGTPQPRQDRRGRRRSSCRQLTRSLCPRSERSLGNTRALALPAGIPTLSGPLFTEARGYAAPGMARTPLARHWADGGGDCVDGCDRWIHGFRAQCKPGRVWCSAAVAPAVGRAYHRFRWRRIDYRPVRRS
jgi:hypothetical protein